MCDKERFKRYFFVDYENVKENGLNGIMKLSEEDCVKIYYSNNAEKMTFGLHRRITVSKAHFDYMKVQMPIKNAIDCQILNDMKDLIKQDRSVECVIVSEDKDYDKAIAEHTARNLKVKKVSEICKLGDIGTESMTKKNEIKAQSNLIKKPKMNQSSAKKISDEKREAQIRSLFGRVFKERMYVEKKEEIIQVLIDATTKQQVNNGLLKLYSNETVSKMIKALQPLTKNMPGR